MARADARTNQRLARCAPARQQRALRLAAALHRLPRPLGLRDWPRLRGGGQGGHSARAQPALAGGDPADPKAENG
eukprot:10255372-Alexandrium_andersonii.AAC.1